MVNFGEVTTKKGGRVEVIFENDNIAQDTSKQYTQESFLAEVREWFAESGLKSKKGEVLYLLINAQGLGRYMNQTEYDEWNKAEEKDWFHQGLYPLPSYIRSMLTSIILSKMLDGFGRPNILGGIMIPQGIPIPGPFGMDGIGLSDIFGGVMLPQGMLLPGSIEIVIQDYDMADENSERPSGPSAEQLKEVAHLDLGPDSPNVVEVILSGNCEACPRTHCRKRKSSFSVDACKKALEQAASES